MNYPAILEDAKTKPDYPRTEAEEKVYEDRL